MTADKEKRRAISREAARRRRRVESDVFGDLSRLLPLHPSIQSHLDKPTVIRLTLSYIRMHTVLKGNAGIKTEASHAIKYGPAIEGAENKTDLEKRKQNGGQEEKEREVEKREAEKREVEKREAEKREAEEREAEYRETEETSMYLKILEGFLMVVSTEGDMMYLSGNVNKYMGLTQTELMGHNIFDFTHPCDHEEIRNNLRLTAEEVWRGAKRDFVMRIKSALTHRGRSANLKSATWKVLHCQGRAKMCIPPSSGACLLLTCQPLPLSHTLLSTHTFTSQHSMDMRFTHCDQRVTVLLGYTAEELVGRSIYNLCHAQDINRLRKNHLNLCWKSQSVSGQYRMLVKGGGYVWVESHSAVIPSVRPSKSRPGAHQPLCILCVTYVLSGVEQASLQLSLDQTGHRYLS